MSEIIQKILFSPFLGGFRGGRGGSAHSQGNCGERTNKCAPGAARKRW